MNSFKCPQCGGNQYTAVDEVEECIYCGHRELEKMDTLEPELEEGGEGVIWQNVVIGAEKRSTFGTQSKLNSKLLSQVKYDEMPNIKRRV